MTYDAPQGMDTDDTPVGDAADHTAELVQRAAAGDQRAFGEIYDAWFDRVHDLAYGVVRDRSVAAEVAQDTFLRAWQRLDTVRDPTVFGGWLLRIARNTALNRLRTERRTTAVDDQGMAVIERGGPSPASAPAGFRVEDRLHTAEDPASAVEDDEIVALVGDAADALDGRDAEVLHLGLRYGLTPAEIGEAIGLNRNAANQAVHRARRRLRTAVEARVLWRRGRPDCPGLADALADAGVVRFGAEAVAVADAHAATCERCTEQRRLRLDPAVLFGAVPLVGAPAMLKTQIAHALAGQGIPMQGSTHAGGASSGSAAGPGEPGEPGEPGPGEADEPGAGDQHALDQALGDAGPGETAALLGPMAPVEPARAERRGRRRLALALAGVATVVAVGVAVVALADSSGEGARSGAVPATRPDALVTPSSTGAPTTVPTTAVPETTPPETAPPGTAPPGTAPPGTAPPGVVTPPVTDPPPPPPAPTGTISITPPTKSNPWTMTAGQAPLIAWSTENAGSALVEGDGFSSTAPGGSALLCPNGGSGTLCNAALGTYRYRLTVFDASGAVALTREVLLVVVD